MLRIVSMHVAKHLYSFLLSCILSAFFALPVFADFVSDETAVDMIEGWLRESTERLGENFTFEIREVIPFEDPYGEVIYYVVHMEPEGYIIASADDLIEPIIAFSDSGMYDPNENNPLHAMLSRDIPERILEAYSRAYGSKQRGLKKTRVLPQSAMKAKRKWTRLQGNFVSDDGSKREGQSSISDVRIAPLIQSQWSQSTAQGQYCYNYYTPNHYVCGCVATAMAQLMRYHQHPADGIGQITKEIEVDDVSQNATTRGGDGAGGAYNWSIMPLKPLYATYVEAQWQQIGALCYDTGVCVRMSYSNGGSSASLYYTDLALTNNFNYDNAIYMYSSEGISWSDFTKVINSNLKGGFPVILGIERTGGGHAVVADGLGIASSTWYHHINMGWGGSYDAWYYLPTIDAGSYTYTVIDTINYNVFPDNIGEIISGRVLDFSGNPVEGRTVTAQVQGGGTTYTGTTDANGYYAIVGVPSNTTFDVTDGSTTRSGIATGQSTDWGSCGNYDKVNFPWTRTGPDVRNTPYLYAANLNSDSRTDLIYIGLKGYIYYTTDLSTWSNIGENKFSMVVAGDFSDNGTVENDLAGINLNGYVLYTTNLSSWEKSGSNKLTSLISVDFDGNGAKDDLAGVNPNQYVIYSTDLSSWAKSGSNKFSSILSFDDDGDGVKDDLVGINLNSYCLYTTTITANWKKSGANKFTSIITADLTAAAEEKDLAGVNLNQYCIYATVITANWKKSGANKFSSIVSADFDGDNKKDDLAGINLNQYILYATDITGNWARIGLNRFTSVVCGDFDADGAEDDLAAVNLNEHVLYTIHTTDFSDWTKIEKP